MSKNMSMTDRGVRAIIGVAAALLPVTGVLAGVWAWVAYMVAAVLIVTAVAGFCPAYRVFGWSTEEKAAPTG